jgi:tRNA (mo5U34)-methyltransferase
MNSKVSFAKDKGVIKLGSETELEPRSKEEWQSEIDSIQWYHDFDFGNGLRAESATEKQYVDGLRQIWGFIETQLGKFDFANKSVLEVGAWDGFWSFYAERHGARSVLATDDTSQNWASGKGLHLARKLLRSKIEIRQDVPIYNLESLNRKFDIILCLGVFYHLRDPFYGFTQLRHCCHADTVLLLEGQVRHEEIEEHAVYYSGKNPLECLPGESGIKNLLQWAYLSPESLVWMHPTQRTESDRAFIVCRPFTGVNEIYVYKPHFGLHVYDDRFNQPR